MKWPSVRASDYSLGGKLLVYTKIEIRRAKDQRIFALPRLVPKGISQERRPRAAPVFSG
jgi:hypothetical protein